MKFIAKFVRGNPTLAFGLGLPLVMVAAFFVASKIEEAEIEPPKYDLLFALNSNGSMNAGKGFHIEVRDQKAHVVYKGESSYYPVPKLYKYEVATGTLHEIPLSFPDSVKDHARTSTDKDSPDITLVAVPELDTLMLDTHTTAPDGYLFAQGGNNYSHDLLSGLLMGFRGYENGIVLKKSNRLIRVEGADIAYAGNTQFIGWVIPQ